MQKFSKYSKYKEIYHVEHLAGLPNKLVAGGTDGMHLNIFKQFCHVVLWWVRSFLQNIINMDP